MKNYQKASYKLADAISKLPVTKREAIMKNCFEVIASDVQERIKEKSDVVIEDIEKKDFMLSVTIDKTDLRMIGIFLTEYKGIVEIINSDNDEVINDAKRFIKLINSHVKI